MKLRNPKFKNTLKTYTKFFYNYIKTFFITTLRLKSDKILT